MKCKLRDAQNTSYELAQITNKLVFKAESKVLGGNICITVLEELEVHTTLGITVFDITGNVHFDSVVVDVPTEVIKFATVTGEVISLIEDIYIKMQLNDLQSNKARGSYVH